MSYSTPIPLEAMHNLASWLHHDSIALDLLTLTCPKAIASFNHYTLVGSKYCPRVLLACEQMLNTFHKDGTINTYEAYTSTPHPDAFIPTR